MNSMTTEQRPCSSCVRNLYPISYLLQPEEDVINEMNGQKHGYTAGILSKYMPFTAVKYKSYEQVVHLKKAGFPSLFAASLFSPGTSQSLIKVNISKSLFKLVFFVTRTYEMPCKYITIKLLSIYFENRIPPFPQASARLGEITAQIAQEVPAVS